MENRKIEEVLGTEVAGKTENGKNSISFSPLAATKARIPVSDTNQSKIYVSFPANLLRKQRSQIRRRPTITFVKKSRHKSIMIWAEMTRMNIQTG